MAALPQGAPPEVPKKTEKVLQMSKVLNPDALAPGKCHLHPKADTVVIAAMWGWRHSKLLPAPRNPPPKFLYIYQYITCIYVIYT